MQNQTPMTLLVTGGAETCVTGPAVIIALHHSGC
jgi:hypothetical protein